VGYAAVMGAEAVAALATGWMYERIHGWVLLALPVLVAAVPALVFTDVPLVALVGVLLWGMATGIQDSTVKALVADLVPAGTRATAYGVFAAVQGATAITGGVLAGTLYEHSLPVLIVAVGAVQLLGLGLLIAALRPASASAS
jgi:MFS-type transporter involved in bile tolerance (Atg22 family)